MEEQPKYSNLLREIEQKRIKLLQLTKKEQLSSEEVVRCSQELDKLISDYLKKR